MFLVNDLIFSGATTLYELEPPSVERHLQIVKSAFLKLVEQIFKTKLTNNLGYMANIIALLSMQYFTDGKQCALIHQFKNFPRFMTLRGIAKFRNLSTSTISRGDAIGCSRGFVYFHSGHYEEPSEREVLRDVLWYNPDLRTATLTPEAISKITQLEVEMYQRFQLERLERHNRYLEELLPNRVKLEALLSPPAPELVRRDRHIKHEPTSIQLQIQRDETKSRTRNQRQQFNQKQKRPKQNKGLFRNR